MNHHDMKVESVLARIRAVRAGPPDGLGIATALDDAIETIAAVVAELESTSHLSSGRELHELVDIAIDTERTSRDSAVLRAAESAAQAARRAALDSYQHGRRIPLAPCDTSEA